MREAGTGTQTKPSAPAASWKRGVGQGKERDPSGKFPVLKLFGTGVGRAPREVGVEPWDPRGRGWGWGLRVHLWKSHGSAGGLHLEKEGRRRGHKVEVVELGLERLQGDWERQGVGCGR